ncbi:MAG: hypothetical protein ACTSWL_09885, partial [Promethearchaeota archaeon]
MFNDHGVQDALKFGPNTGRDIRLKLSKFGSLSYTTIYRDKETNKIMMGIVNPISGEISAPQLITDEQNTMWLSQFDIVEIIDPEDNPNLVQNQDPETIHNSPSSDLSQSIFGITTSSDSDFSIGSISYQDLISWFNLNPAKLKDFISKNFDKYNKISDKIQGIAPISQHTIEISRNQYIIKSKAFYKTITSLLIATKQTSWLINKHIEGSSSSIGQNHIKYLSEINRKISSPESKFGRIYSQLVRFIADLSIRIPDIYIDIEGNPTTNPDLTKISQYQKISKFPIEKIFSVINIDYIINRVRHVLELRNARPSLIDKYDVDSICNGIRNDLRNIILDSVKTMKKYLLNKNELQNRVEYATSSDVFTDYIKDVIAKLRGKVDSYISDDKFLTFEETSKTYLREWNDEQINQLLESFNSMHNYYPASEAKKGHLFGSKSLACSQLLKSINSFSGSTIFPQTYTKQLSNSFDTYFGKKGTKSEEKNMNTLQNIGLLLYFKQLFDFWNGIQLGGSLTSAQNYLYFKSIHKILFDFKPGEIMYHTWESRLRDGKQFYDIDYSQALAIPLSDHNYLSIDPSTGELFEREGIPAEDLFSGVSEPTSTLVPSRTPSTLAKTTSIPSRSFQNTISLLIEKQIDNFYSRRDSVCGQCLEEFSRGKVERIFREHLIEHDGSLKFAFKWGETSKLMEYSSHTDMEKNLGRASFSYDPESQKYSIGENSFIKMVIGDTDFPQFMRKKDLFLNKEIRDLNQRELQKDAIFVKSTNVDFTMILKSKKDGGYSIMAAELLDQLTPEYVRDKQFASLGMNTLGMPYSHITRDETSTTHSSFLDLCYYYSWAIQDKVYGKLSDSPFPTVAKVKNPKYLASLSATERLNPPLATCPVTIGLNSPLHTYTQQYLINQVFGPYIDKLVATQDGENYLPLYEFNPEWVLCHLDIILLDEQNSEVVSAARWKDLPFMGRDTPMFNRWDLHQLIQTQPDLANHQELWEQELFRFRIHQLQEQFAIDF